MTKVEHVICVETGEWFYSIKEACESAGCTRAMMKTALAKGLRINGQHWKVAPDERRAIPAAKLIDLI